MSIFLTALASVSDPQHSQTRHSIKQDPHDLSPKCESWFGAVPGLSFESSICISHWPDIFLPNQCALSTLCLISDAQRHKKT